MSYGIGGIGTSYANDPAFWSVYSSYNPNYYLQMQQQAAQQAAAQAGTSVPDSTQTTTNPTSGVSFQGSEKESSSSGIGTGLLVGGAVVASAATLLYAAKKGNGAGIKAGFKNIWNSITGKAGKAADKADDVASKISNLIKDGGKNLKEYTIQKDGMSFVMKDGKPVKIITQDKKVIDPKDIKSFLSKNPSIENEVNKLNLTGATLPKGVNLSYTKEIVDGKKTYRMTVENGKVVKVSGKDKAGKWSDVADNQLEAFIKNHGKQVKEAETLTRTFGGKDVQLADKKGVLKKQNGSIQMNVRNGEIISAKFNGTRDLTEKELEALQKDYSSIVQNFGKENASRYGLTNYEYVYRQKGGQTVRFNNSRNITDITSVTEKQITNSDAVKNWLETNSGIKTELENIASTGSITSGYRIGNLTYKTDAGHTFEIAGGKIKGIKLDKNITLCGKTFKSGDLINGKYLAEWRKTAENNNAYDAVSALL